MKVRFRQLLAMPLGALTERLHTLTGMGLWSQLARRIRMEYDVRRTKVRSTWHSF